MNESNTPRVDAEEKRFNTVDAFDDRHTIPADFARQLETELNQLAAENRMLKQCNGQLNELVETLEQRHAATMMHGQSVVDEVKAVTASRDEWRKVAEEMAEAIKDTGDEVLYPYTKSLAAFTALQQEEAK